MRAAHSNRTGLRYDDTPSPTSEHVYISCSFMKYGDEEAWLPIDAHGSRDIHHLAVDKEAAYRPHGRCPGITAGTLSHVRGGSQFGQGVTGDQPGAARFIPPLQLRLIASTVTTLSRNRPIAAARRLHFRHPK